MSLDIGAAVRGGTSRLATRSGAVLLVAFLVLSLVSTVLTQSLNVAVTEAFVGVAESNPAVDSTALEQLRAQLQTTRESSPLAVGMPAALAIALSLLAALVAEAATLVAIRTFVAATNDSSPLASAVGRGNLGFATLNGFLGGIVVGALVVLGAVALVLPGLFLYVSFLFLRQRIAVEDENFIEAMTGAWRLSRGNRFSLFGLAVVVVLASLAAFVPGLVIADASPLVGTAVGSLLSPLVTLFGVAVTSRAYVQLREEDGSEGEEEPAADPYAGPLGPDDLPDP